MAPLRQAGKRILLSLAQQVQPAAERVPTLVFLGPPGVGKGTYSLRIAKQLGLAHISVGDLIRHEINIGTKPGKAVSLTFFVSTCDCCFTLAVQIAIQRRKFDS